MEDIILPDTAPGQTPSQRSSRGPSTGGSRGPALLGKLFGAVTEAIGATKELLADGDLRKCVHTDHARRILSSCADNVKQLWYL